MAKIDVGIVNQSPILRSALVDIVSGKKRFRVIWDCGTPDELDEHIAAKCPDVVVIECGFTGDHDFVANLVAEHCDVAFVISGIDGSIDQLSAFAAAGSRGYIRAGADEKDWLTAIDGACRGEIHDPVIAGALNSCLSRVQVLQPRGADEEQQENIWHVSDRVGNSARNVGLTARERQVLELIDRGLSNKDIGRTLQIEPATVKAHVHSILGKYNVNRRGEAAAQFRSAKSARIVRI